MSEINYKNEYELLCKELDRHIQLYEAKRNALVNTLEVRLQDCHNAIDNFISKGEKFAEPCRISKSRRNLYEEIIDLAKEIL